MKRHQAVRAAALSAMICGGLQQAAWAQLRAFGEAEGFGATVTGGRAATTVYHVTNLNDSGAGSFRDAVSGSNRIIVFDVGGVINLKSAVSCKSNLTIAGQTAPGGGISLNGAEVSFSSQSNIICRYLHFRPGDGSSGSDAGVALYNSRNVILDHSSIEFAKYDNIDAVTDNGNDPNITVQSSIIADPISNGSSNTGQGFGAHLEAVGGHMTLVNNLWANSHNRNPLAKVNDQFVNNIDYNNEASYTTHTSTPFSHDLVNNAFIYGPATGGNTFYQLSGGDKFYANGNVQDANLDGLLNGSAIDPVTASGTGTSKSSPNFSTTAGLPTLSVAAAYAYVLAHAGASLTHDELDSLVLSQLATLGNGTAGTGTGTSGPDNGLYHSAASTGLANGGLGVTAAGSRAAGFDADNDGIADTWEVAHGLSPSDPTDAFKLNPLGYLMIEQYLNELGSTNDSHTSQASNANWNNPSTWGDATVPTAMDYAVIRGNGTTSGSVVVNGAASAMKISLGGNGSSTGESLSVVGGGNLSVYDTITVGDLGDATLAITGGSVSAYNIQLGNTLNGLTHTGTLNFSAGTLGVSQIVLGGGTPGAWTTGGSMNWTGGTLQAIAAMNINVPIALGGTAGVIDTNGYNATISGPLTGSIGLTKTGAGTLTLTGNSTFTGGVKVNADTLSINSTNGAGTGGVTLANGTTLNLGGPGGSSVNNPILVQQNATLTGGYITAGGTISGAAGA
ncbi:MAG: autotransporter-associated beta strand repeat-containing protein, partial [Tepidisphaeraceae bacterium]